MSLALIGHLRDFGKCSKFYISGFSAPVEQEDSKARSLHQNEEQSYGDGWCVLS